MAPHRDRNRLFAVVCLGAAVRLLPGEALQVVKDPGYTVPCRSAWSLLELGDANPDPLGEVASDIGDEIKNMTPSIARDILVFASPQARDSHLLNDAARHNSSSEHTPPKAGATCTVWRPFMYNQYAFCTEFNSTLAPRNGTWTALSFGGNGYDPWSHAVSKQLGVVPEVYDCFDPRPIRGVIMHDACIGGRVERKARATWDDGRKLKWEDLNDILRKAQNRSVLMKLDIEHSEYGVLQELSDESLGKLASFTVEFHFLGDRCCGFAQHRKLLQRLQETFAVLDGHARRWGKPSDCGIEGGYQWPSALAVTYVARDILVA